MAQAKKQGDKKGPGLKVKFLNLLLVLLGADLILLFAPGVGMLNSVIEIRPEFLGELIAWLSLFLGIVLLVFGFKGLYQKR